MGRQWLFAAVLGAATLNGACADGGQSFTPFMSPTDERRIGAEEHPKILARFGGVYDDPEIGAYVAAIGGRLAGHTGMAASEFRFTVLNSPVVNAFALPGGYVYISRGLMALANSEAELAGVLAHEIGHVVARHAAQRYSQAMAVGLGTAALGIVLGNNVATQLAQLGGELYLKGFSREQEYEADRLGVDYLGMTGYAPIAQAEFLASLQRESALMNASAGKAGAEREIDFFSTHPRTADRVERAIQEAERQPQNPVHRRDEYLDRIDGLLYGDDPKQGFVRGRKFLHPVLRFAFEVPPDFRLINTDKAVLAQGPAGTGIRFDQESDQRDLRAARDAYDYLVRIWAGRQALRDAERLVVNGLDAATGWTTAQGPSGPLDVRLVAIRADARTLYRFLFLTPPALTGRLATDLQRTTYSFRLLSEGEAATLRPLRLRIVTVRPGDTVASLAAKLPFVDRPSERLRVLNALNAGEEPRPGERVKVVVE